MSTVTSQSPSDWAAFYYPYLLFVPISKRLGCFYVYRSVSISKRLCFVEYAQAGSATVPISKRSSCFCRPFQSRPNLQAIGLLFHLIHITISSVANGSTFALLPSLLCLADFFSSLKNSSAFSLMIAFFPLVSVASFAFANN